MDDVLFLQSITPLGSHGEIDREKRAINGFAVISRGEALGHDFFIDLEFLAQVVEAGNKAPLKSRFGHPSMFGDALGKLLGSATNFRIKDDKVIADLKFNKSSESTPSGNLSKHVMDVVEETPQFLGTSIAFGRDFDAEDEFLIKHRKKDKEFESPDPLNTKNFIHVRLKELRAVDVVDEPAANPAGMFSTSGSKDESDLKEMIKKYEVELSKLSDLLQEKKEKETPMSEETKVSDEQLATIKAQAAKDEQNRCKEIMAAFPDDAEFASKQIQDGKSLLEAKAEYSEFLQIKIKKMNEKTEADAKASTKKDDGQDAVDFSSGDDDGKDKKEKDFMQLAKAHAKEFKCGITEAMKAVIHEDSKSHDSFLEACPLGKD